MMDNIDISGPPEIQDYDVYDAEGNITGEKQRRSNFAPALVIPMEGDLVEEDLVIVFLDEIPNAETLTMKATFKMIDEGKIGDNRVHPKVRWVMAGNPVSTSRAANQLPEPLKNRSKHYMVASDTDDWLDYASSAGYHPAILAYIELNKAELNISNWEMDKRRAAIEEGAYPTERSWEMLSKSLYAIEEQRLPMEFLVTEVAATVGSGIALSFTEFYKNNEAIPTPKDLFNGKIAKDQDTYNMDKSQKLFLITCLLSYLKQYLDNYDSAASGVSYYKDSTYITMMDNLIDYAELLLDAEDRATLASRFIVKYCFMLDFSSTNGRMKDWWDRDNGDIGEYIDALD